MTDKFLRGKSDNEFKGWAIGNFILVFQYKDDIKLENELREGPIYAIEIDLEEDEPMVYLSKYDYDDIKE